MTTTPAMDVVLVDDHDDTREVAAEVLRLQGFEVRDFGSAEEALDAVLGRAPSAVITDLTLGGMSGEDLARRLRASTDTGGVALVAMTGHTSARENLEKLWDAVLIKPVDPFELARQIRELVESR
ncbi:MAG: response regulator [Myxococcota bacterium]|nr:response regulator [Myxococcota bacterium]